MLDKENFKMENARHGKLQKNHTLENGRKYMPRKMAEWKMYNMVNGRTEIARH